MNSKPDGRLVLLKEENSGRDEMNLAGNPFALLQTAKDGQNLIRSEWEKQLPSGKIVTASWEVSGHPQLGLPGPSDELLFLVLMQLTREQSGSGDWIQTVHFSRFDLISRLGWANTATYYNMLQDGLKRLASVNITACHTFWDAKAKLYVDSVNFHILEGFSLYDEPKGKKTNGAQPLSSFKWSDRVHQSFLAGNVRSLALNFIISLELPTTRRLFRFLDMMRGSTAPPRREFSIGLFKLTERLGMTSYKYASKIKTKLTPAITELITRGYLSSVEYKKNKDGQEMAIFHFGDAAKEALHIEQTQTRPEQGRVEQGSASSTPQKPKTTPKPRPTQLTLTDDPTEHIEATTSAPTTPTETNAQADALRAHAIFQTLPPAEQAELLEQAKQEISPIWHDRVGQPESPMSLGLWELVMARYGKTP